jgi:hypothetical protein
VSVDGKEVRERKSLHINGKVEKSDESLSQSSQHSHLKLKAKGPNVAKRKKVWISSVESREPTSTETSIAQTFLWCHRHAFLASRVGSILTDTIEGGGSSGAKRERLVWISRAE